MSIGPEDPDEQEKPTPFDRGLANTDTTIKWATVFNAGAAIVAAAAAFYAASQISGSSRQTDAAISQMADLAQEAHSEDVAINGEIVQLKRQADSTEKLVKPTEKSANAAVKSVLQQQAHFQLDERPILAETSLPPDFPSGPIYSPSTQKIFWDFAYKNYGKSIAFNIKGYVFISIDGGPFSPMSYNHYGRYQDDAPNVGNDWSSVVSDQTFSSSEYERIRKTDAGVTILVVLRYQDAAGNSYMSTICHFNHENGPIGNCTLNSLRHPPPPNEYDGREYPFPHQE